MKTFGLFIILFFITILIIISFTTEFTQGEILILSMLYAYIMQQYITKGDNDN